VPPASDLHALVAGFADVAAVYERGRPDYPPAMVERVVAELGVAPGARVLDLGAGTGKLTRPLLAAGLDVVAVEPMERMRAALAAAVGAERALDGRAEALPFPDASLEGAVCGEAFHWFDGERAAAELHRVLRPGAGLVLSWLAYQSDEPPWGDEIVALLDPLWERGRHPGIKVGRRGEAVAEHPGFEPVHRVELSFEDERDRDGLLAWFASFSVVGALPDDERADFLARIAAILDRHGVEGVTRSWRADLWVTRRRPGAGARPDDIEPRRSE
jgi:SAM-dependent methyltransferase